APRGSWVAAGLSGPCVPDETMEPPPAEHARRPAVPPGITDPGVHPSAVRGPAHRRPPVAGPERLRAGGHARAGRPADLRGHRRRHRRSRRGAWSPGAARVRQGHQGGPGPLPPAVRRAIDRATGDRARGPVLLNSRGARMDRHAATRRLHRLAGTAGIQVARAHPHMLRHTFVTTMLDAGVDLRDVQIAARHADPRTTMRYDRARQNLARHPNYILAAFMATRT